MPVKKLHLLFSGPKLAHLISRSKIRPVPTVPWKLKVESCKVLPVQKFLRTHVNRALISHFTLLLLFFFFFRRCQTIFQEVLMHMQSFFFFFFFFCSLNPSFTKKMQYRRGFLKFHIGMCTKNWKIINLCLREQF